MTQWTTKKKMTCLCSKISIIKWFEYYLSNKTFFVSVDKVFLEAISLNCGAFEGFILKLLLFSADINDLPVYIMVSHFAIKD